MENTCVIESEKTVCSKNKHKPKSSSFCRNRDMVSKLRHFVVRLNSNEENLFVKKASEQGISQAELVRRLIRNCVRARPYMETADMVLLRSCCLELSRFAASLMETSRLVATAAQTGNIELDCAVLESEFPDAIRKALEAKDRILAVINKAESRTLIPKDGGKAQ